jgi:hypothetical protein
VEVTKRLKPSVKRVTKYGNSASVQAVMRVNAEFVGDLHLAIQVHISYVSRLKQIVLSTNCVRIPS